MVGWSVVFLPETDRDLLRLQTADATLPARLRDGILGIFMDPFKAARFLDAVEGHARTAQVDRLEGSAFPQSFRIQVLHDYRATLWCLPSFKQVAIVHVFSKSSDPAYRQALVAHDARLDEYFLRFKEFADRAERRRGRSGTPRAGRG